MNAYVDASVLIALGGIGELDRLTVFEAAPVVLPRILDEVTTEPERTAVERALDDGPLHRGPVPDRERLQAAARMLADPMDSGDTQLLAAVLADLDADERTAVISDDRRVRTVAKGLGATVTGTIGVVIRHVEAGLDPETAKRMVRQLDQSGLHLTAGLQQRASELIDEAAE